MKRLFTSESVTEGHPDKICDQISDAIVDAIMENDPRGRVAAETTVNTGYAMIMGEISTNCYVDITRIARDVILDIGYDRSDYGFDGNTCAVLTAIDEQSTDIAMGVDDALEERGTSKADRFDQIGAGDQGLMFGYACNETPELMPLPLSMAQKLTRRLTEARKKGELTYLRPDGKSQVTVEYEDGKVNRIDTVLLSTQHDPDVSHQQLESDMVEKIIRPTLPPGLVDENTKYLVNPTGRFVIGGPHGDSGLTGRKIIVDTYGGMARHGGGAFSGKDPTKVDRSASYMARYAAKNIVAAGLADKCEIQVSYAIGVAKPLSIAVDSFGTGMKSDEELSKIVRDHFDFRPAAIIENLDLQKPIYRQVASGGHFGRPDLDLSWEKTDKAKELK